MSSSKTHEIRSHRSKRDYKPVNKAMAHAAAKRRKEVRHFIDRIGSGVKFLNNVR